MTPDLYITRAVYKTTTEHLALFAGDPANLNQIKNVLRASPLPAYRLDVLAGHLARLTPCPWSREITKDEVRVCLGEHGDVWPGSIKRSVLLATFEDVTLH